MANTITPIETIRLGGVKVWVKREDQNHPIVQGNKRHKLKYNLIKARQQAAQTLLTFGGAYSNHLIATAFAAQEAGFQSVGVVRGEELQHRPESWSDTLKNCQAYGMQLHFVSRSDYRLKERSPAVQDLLTSPESTYIIPEGGSNEAALKGVAEWVVSMKSQLNHVPSHVICPVGTGGTLAGIIAGCRQNQWPCQVLGISVLKGLQGVKSNINQWLKNCCDDFSHLPEWQINNQYCGDGYAKLTPEMQAFGRQFKANHGFELDQIYNVKSFYALNKMIQNGDIKITDRPVIIHTGGLQGGTL